MQPSPYRPRHRVPALLLAALALGAFAGPLDAARAGWPRPQVGAEVSSVRFSPIVDYLGYNEGIPESGIPDAPQPRRMEADDTDFRGFSFGLSLHEDLVVAWTRSTGSAQLRYYVDGIERIDGQEKDGITTRLPEMDYTLDVFSLRWAPGRVRWQDRVGPVVGLGLGSIDQEQTSELNIDGRPLQWGDTDRVLEASLGAEFRAPWVRAGLDLRMARWRFEPESTIVPAEITRAWLLVGWLRAAF